MSFNPLDEEAIFRIAAEIPSPEARAEYLRQTCGDDVSLLDRVTVLLRADEVSEGFLESPPPGIGATAWVPPLTERVGTQIGPYILREQIGEGGFGVVFVAEQTEPVRRKVALKVIKPGMDTKEVNARFEAERQALALMDHPNIARVLDAGATETGRPFFAMELVNGVPITEFCDTQRLSTTERLRLFVEVCLAVQHAHQKGIIHRDIKPSNVMVTMRDHRPTAKVIDFGVAKALGTALTGKTIYTAYGQMIGTPMYMSPEQAQMSEIDVDTRSDVYSLGVLAYELLTGSPPFDKESLEKAGIDEMRRIIVEQHPRRPSALVSTLQANRLSTVCDQRKIDANRLCHALQGELDWIVMKSLDKDRTRRYETAASLADDVSRYLKGDAVLACPPTTAYRIRKFAERHRAGIAVAAAMLLLVTLGTAATAWQAVLARTEAQQAIAERDRADHERDRAKEAKEQASAERDRATLEKTRADNARKEAETTAQFLIDMFQRARPTDAKGGRDVKVADVLDDAVKNLAGNESIPPQRRAKLQDTIARTYFELGMYREAAKLLEAVRDDRQEDLGLKHPETLKTMGTLADYYRCAGRHEEGIALSEQVLRLCRSVYGEQHADTLQAMNVVANAYFETGRLDEATQLYRDALELKRKVYGPEHPQTLDAMQNLAAANGQAGRLDEAIELNQQVLELRHKLGRSEHPETLMTMRNLAAFYGLAGRSQEAAELNEHVLPLLRQVFGPEHPHTLSTMSNLAACYTDQKRLEEAIQLEERVLKLKRKIQGEQHPDTIPTMLNLTTAYMESGNVEAAIEMAEQALPLCRKSLTFEHRYTRLAMSRLLDAYMAVSRHNDAVELATETESAIQRTYGANHINHYHAMVVTRKCLTAAGRDGQAAEQMRRMAKVLNTLDRRRFLDNDPRVAQLAAGLTAELDSGKGQELRRWAKTREGREELLSTLFTTLWDRDATPMNRHSDATTETSTSGDVVRQIQELLVGLKDFRHPAFPGMSFTVVENEEHGYSIQVNDAPVVDPADNQVPTDSSDK